MVVAVPGQAGSVLGVSLAAPVALGPVGGQDGWGTGLITATLPADAAMPAVHRVPLPILIQAGRQVLTVGYLTGVVRRVPVVRRPGNMLKSSLEIAAEPLVWV
jgi:hypothetical protein